MATKATEKKTVKKVDPEKDKRSAKAMARFVDQPGQWIGEWSPAMKKLRAEMDKKNGNK